jgi:hypothetical protein
MRDILLLRIQLFGKKIWNDVVYTTLVFTIRLSPRLAIRRVHGYVWSRSLILT